MPNFGALDLTLSPEHSREWRTEEGCDLVRDICGPAFDSNILKSSRMV